MRYAKAIASNGIDAFVARLVSSIPQRDDASGKVGLLGLSNGGFSPSRLVRRIRA